MKRVLALVEGQTEERFIKDLLQPHLWVKEVHITPTILVTKRVKSGSSFRGGITSFAKFARDAERLLSDAGGALVTTMLDYYALPQDFPGMSNRPSGSSKERVYHVERALIAHFGFPANFLPFLTLHEFEALLFSSTSELPETLARPKKQADFAAIRASFKTPEDINERRGHSPSQRIQALFPEYRKLLHGPQTARRIGLERIRAECPHFAQWLHHLEAYSVRG